MGDLILYHFELSFYSQLARTGLAEKKLSYKKKSVDFEDLDHIAPQYMKLNPKGQVPTLVHGEQVITDFAEIIKYLDDNFTESVKLVPDSESDEGERWSYLKELGDKFKPFQMLTSVPWYPEIAGSDHPDIKKKKYLAEMIWKVMREDIPKKCDVYAEENPDLKEAYEEKKEQVAKLPEEPDVEDMQLTLAIMGDVLTQIDRLLKPDEPKANEEANNKKETQKWLCGDHYSIADIYWSIILNWLDEAGLANRYWGEGKRANLAAYYETSKERDSFKKGTPSAMTLMLYGLKSRWCAIL